MCEGRTTWPIHRVAHSSAAKNDDRHEGLCHARGEPVGSCRGLRVNGGVRCKGPGATPRGTGELWAGARRRLHRRVNPPAKSSRARTRANGAVRECALTELLTINELHFEPPTPLGLAGSSPGLAATRPDHARGSGDPEAAARGRPPAAGPARPRTAPPFPAPRSRAGPTPSPSAQPRRPTSTPVCRWNPAPRSRQARRPQGAVARATAPGRRDYISHKPPRVGSQSRGITGAVVPGRVRPALPPGTQALAGHNRAV